MSFAEFETSVDRGEPVLLYLFRYGEPDDAIIAYTDCEQDIDALDDRGNACTYKAIAIERDAITASGSLDRSALEVRTSDDVEIADLFRLYPPSYVVTLIISQGHANDPDDQFLVEWSGRVIGFSTDEDNVAHFNCEPISTSMKRAGLRRHWQYGCPHALYGTDCGANKAAATEANVVLEVSGAVLTFDPDWSDRKEKFRGGLAEWTHSGGRSESRTILRTEVDGSVVLSGYATGLEAGMTVALILGCNHKGGVGPQPDGDCHLLHDNVQNFGGQMWIPTKNPFGLNNNYY